MFTRAQTLLINRASPVNPPEIRLHGAINTFMI